MNTFSNMTTARVLRVVVWAFAIVGVVVACMYAAGMSSSHGTTTRVVVRDNMAYASRVDVEALWSDHDALVACIANTAYTRDLIPQCLDDYADAYDNDSTRVVKSCNEDEPCWDCATMGNRICGPKGP